MDLVKELAALRTLAQLPKLDQLQRAEAVAICIRIAAHVEKDKPNVTAEAWDAFTQDERHGLLIMYAGLIQGILQR